MLVLNLMSTSCRNSLSYSIDRTSGGSSSTVDIGFLQVLRLLLSMIARAIAYDSHPLGWIKGPLDNRADNNPPYLYGTSVRLYDVSIDQVVF